ncbi:MAG: Fe-S cluster assembly protein SufD [Mycobacteriaceae bacterium]
MSLDSKKENLNTLIENKGSSFSSFDVNAFEVPSGRDELWRFTPLRRLRGLHDGSAPPTGMAQIEVQAPKSVVTELVPRSDVRLGQAGIPADRVAAQAFSSFSKACIVSLGKEIELEDPIVLTVTGPGVDRVAYGHLQVRIAEFSRVTVVIEQRGSGTYAENLEFIIGDHANVTVVVLQDWEQDVVHIAAQHCLLGANAQLQHFNISLGGEVVRISPTVRYSAAGGNAQMWGLYFADDGQHLEQRLLVDHSQPNCTSHVVYKGALQGDSHSKKPDAHTVWIGDVVIRAQAQGTKTFELNRNLVLTDGARADSVPNLEIETGEIIGAGHASATGRFDDEQLFYLLARGIPEDAARRLVVRGFFHEIIAKIPIPELRERLENAIEVELSAASSSFNRY